MNDKLGLIELYYDKECPFCNSYANYIKLKKSYELKLFNARESNKDILKFKALGFDINNGYIIKVNHKNIYQGADAIIFLNSLSQKKVFFYDNYFFRNIMYPTIKSIRKLILFFLNKNSSI